MRTLLTLICCTTLVSSCAAASLSSPVDQSNTTPSTEQANSGTSSDVPSYRRSLFPHWSDLVAPARCDTRDEVLERDAADVGEQVTRRDRRGCAAAVVIIDPYTGDVVTGDDEVEIDHVVSLHDAWYSGAYTWTTAQREQFANDPRNLLAVAERENQSKSNATPSSWRPTDPTFWCEYATIYRDMKIEWNLTTTAEDHDALTELLTTC